VFSNPHRLLNCRLVENHFGVKLEDVEEDEEEGQDGEGKHRPSFEQKFQVSGCPAMEWMIQ